MMGRTPCCNVDGLKKGAWTSEEDQKLIAYIQEHGEGGWRTLPQKAGLQRCGKSCRLRWANYLRPDIKRGEFSPEEEDRIIELHASLGNRWSAIARHLPRRTDNEIKNYWNTHLKKRLFEKGIHPTTHKPISPTAGSSSSSDDAVPSLSGNKTPTTPPPAGLEQPQLVPAQAHVSSSSSFSASASASAQLLNKLAAKLAPPPHASSRFSAEQDDEVEEGANGVVEDDARTKPRRRPASSSSSAKLLNKMASRLAHPLHCLNTLKSILSSAAASDRTNLMMHRSASASSLSESTAATTSISTSNNDVPAQTASSKPDQLAFLESLDLDVLNDWHDPQQYDPLIMDFLADSITSKEKQEQPYHYYEEDSSLLPSLYGSHALHSPAYFHDAFRAPAEDEHNFMDFDGPSTSASRNNNDPADDPHCGGGYVVDNQVQVAADDAYGHHQFEYQHGAGGLLDGDDEHGRTLFNNYGDFRIDAASFF